MSYEVWWTTNVVDLGKLIRVVARTLVIGIGVVDLEELKAGARRVLVCALATPKDFQIIKAWIYFFLYQ
jgi:hypothetical protein